MDKRTTLLPIVVMGLISLAAVAISLPEGAPGLPQIIALAAAALTILWAAIALFAPAKSPLPAPGDSEPEQEASTSTPPAANRQIPQIPQPAPTPSSDIRDDALLLLGLLQEKGRFLDFVMDDVSAYNDAQVGAAARVVHTGCRSLINEAFAPEKICSQPENSSVTLPDSDAAKSFQFSGNIREDWPRTGVLEHAGWKATRTQLPRRITTPAPGELPPLAPAKVRL